jgi:hypothetical protein
MVVLAEHLLRGHKKFIRLGALDYFPAGKRLDNLPVDVVC